MGSGRSDWLYGTEYTVRQTEGGYHFNTDTELLGLFLPECRGKSVLDIGCHSGALMLYAAHKGAQMPEGIDLFEEVTRLAKDNLKANGVPGIVHTGDVRAFEGGPYDLIVCNPPYFRESGAMISADPVLAAARHEIRLSLDELFESADRLLKQKGRLCIVHRAARLQEILRTGGKYGFGACRMRIAYRSRTGRGVSVLLEMVRGNRRETAVEPPAFLDCRESFILTRDTKKGQTV